MKRMNGEEAGMQRSGVLKSRRWRYGDGWRERLMGLLGAIENRGLYSIVSSGKLFVIRQAILALGILCLTACATGGNRVIFHTFEFDAYRDSPDIEVLDYQYGDQKTTGFAPERERVKLGQAFRSGGLSGFIPRGDSLYVKWRIKATGEVLEDRVDLRSRLPENLDHLEIHFVCHDRQLHVFVRWPWDEQPWAKEPPNTRYKPIPGGVRRAEGHKIQQIYPDPLPQ